MFQFSAQRGYINLFYSRTINDPSIAAKYTGKIGKTSYGVISARDESSLLLVPFEETSSVVSMGKSTSNIFRAKRMIGGNGGSIGAILTNRVFDDAGDMTTGGLDFHYHPGNNYHITLHATASIHNESDNYEYVDEAYDFTQLFFDNGRYTKAFDGEKITGNALGFSLNKRTRTDNFGVVLRLRSPGFRTSNGFERNNATKWLKASRGKTVFYENNPKLLKTDYNISTIYKTNYSGLVKKQELSFSTSSDLRNGDFFKVSAEFEKENFRFGTKEMLTAVSNSMATTIVSGGHLTTALKQQGLADKINHISTAGGALVLYLTGEKLPMMKALEDAAVKYRSKE